MIPAAAYGCAYCDAGAARYSRETDEPVCDAHTGDGEPVKPEPKPRRVPRVALCRYCGAGMCACAGR